MIEFSTQFSIWSYTVLNYSLIALCVCDFGFCYRAVSALRTGNYVLTNLLVHFNMQNNSMPLASQHWYYATTFYSVMSGPREIHAFLRAPSSLHFCLTFYPGDLTHIQGFNHHGVHHQLDLSPVPQACVSCCLLDICWTPAIHHLAFCSPDAISSLSKDGTSPPSFPYQMYKKHLNTALTIFLGFAPHHRELTTKSCVSYLLHSFSILPSPPLSSMNSLYPPSDSPSHYP